MPKLSFAKIKRSAINSTNRAKRVSKRKFPSEISLRTRRRTKYQLWLDIDYTLLEAYFEPPTIDSFVNDPILLEVKKRPFLSELITFSSGFCSSLTLYTGADKIHTQRKLEAIRFPGLRCLSFDDLTQINFPFVSKTDYLYKGGNALLKLIPDFNIDTTIIVDDIPNFYFGEQRCNVLAIKPLKFDDDALAHVVRFLKEKQARKDTTIAALIKEYELRYPECFNTKQDRKQFEFLIPKDTQKARTVCLRLRNRCKKEVEVKI